METEKPNRGKVLVACASYAGKEYALKEWWDAYNSYTYEDKCVYVVDNTMYGLQYFETLKNMGIKCSHIVPYTDKNMFYTYHKCWELILQEAQREDCYWIYSVEADNVPAPESLQIMIDTALISGVHLVTHDYPMHKTAVDASGMKGDEFYYTEMGCMLMSRKLLERALQDYEEFKNIPMALFNSTDRYHGGWCKMTQKFEVKHLDGYEMEFNQFTEEVVDGWCPTPNVPADYGSVIPPSLRN
jgi:hypothetical protein